MNLLSFKLTTDAVLQIDIASGVVLVLLVVLIGLVYYRRRQFFGKTSYFEVNEAEIGIGSGKLKLKANIEDIQIGWRQTVEHPFGTIKAWIGSTHFLTRTLKNVSTEMSLRCWPTI